MKLTKKRLDELIAWCNIEASNSFAPLWKRNFRDLAALLRSLRKKDGRKR